MADLSVTAASVVSGSNAVKAQGIAGETIAAGKAIYLASSTKKWMLADSNSATAEARKATAIALNGASANQPLVAQTGGDITIGSTVTAGTSYFLSDTPGGICPLADVGSGEYLEIIGVAKSTTVLMLIFAFPNVSL